MKGKEKTVTKSCPHIFGSWAADGGVISDLNYPDIGSRDPLPTETDNRKWASSPPRNSQKMCRSHYQSSRRGDSLNSSVMVYNTHLLYHLKGYLNCPISRLVRWDLDLVQLDSVLIDYIDYLRNWGSIKGDLTMTINHMTDWGWLINSKKIQGLAQTVKFRVTAWVGRVTKWSLGWTARDLCCDAAFGCDACPYFNTVAVLCPFPAINCRFISIVILSPMTL